MNYADDMRESERLDPEWHRPIEDCALDMAKSKSFQSIDSALVYRAALRRLGADCLDSDRYRAMVAYHRREFRYWRAAVRGLQFDQCARAWDAEL